MPKLLTIEQAAAQVGLKPVTLRLQAAKGRLRADKLGPNWVVTQKDLDAYMTNVARKRP